MYYIILIIISSFMVIYLLSNTKNSIKKNISLNSDFMINPENLEKIHVCSNKGKQLMRMYMRCYFKEFLENTKPNWNYILQTELNKENLSKYYLLDVRKQKDFNKGHIAGSINIFWKDLIKPQNIKKLPNNKEIILICYVGHTASQILVMLKLLGYKVRVLKFGIGQSPSVGVPVAGWKNYGFKTSKD